MPILFRRQKSLQHAGRRISPDCLLGIGTDIFLMQPKRVASGEVALDSLNTVPVEQARETLRRIMGVGPKVAECVLLFGFGRHDCFPLDTWMKKVMRRYYPDGLPAAFLPKAGIAQQYLFHYARCFDSF